MKKMLFVAMVCIASLSLSSCVDSTERLVRQYEKACKSGDVEKVEKIAEKMSKLEESDLTEEQALRILKASFEFGALYDAVDEEDIEEDDEE
ncbi:MAG: hypothetical protein MJZ84_07170 [Paludibacteraceae bacterium]|nr:hypothetical protein [Paludibacteraceae bacterium]